MNIFNVELLIHELLFCKILRTIWKTNKQTNFIEYINAILWRRHWDMSELSAIFDKHKWVAWSGDWSTQYSELTIYNQGIPLLHILHTSSYSFTKVALIVRQ